ncbi:hypothetical protein AB6A23_16965 [Paenibacillus tarimensis]
MLTKANQKSSGKPEMKLFAGESLLVITGLIGLVLAAGIAVYIAIYGAVILPEGNVERAFSFNAAIAMFVLSIAAFMPLSGISPRNRTRVRWFFVLATLYSYGIETIQHFRGINPRFSQIGSISDRIAGGLFGLISLLIIIVTVMTVIPFFRKRRPHERPLPVLGIRYGFLSTLLAFAAGLWMIVLQSRYTGAEGNLIVLHGLGFHGLQAIPLLGWLLERAQSREGYARRLIHTGGIAWMLSITLVGIQTALGRSVFEWTAFPIFAGAALLIWLAALLVAAHGLQRPQQLTDSKSS